MRYSLVRTNGEAFLTVFPETGDPLPARNDHPNWDKLVAGVLADDESVLDLFDIGKSIVKRLDRLSERVSIYGGTIYFDNDPIDNALSQQILRFIDEDEEDWEPLVDFFEKLMTNPIEHSREQLYQFMLNNKITITEDGDIVFYKGVKVQTDEDGNKQYLSSSAGHAYVDGEEVNGVVPNSIGSVIEMPRSEVAHDPSAACSTGLHCATFEFAQNFCVGAVLEIHVNPRDVVSVPNNSHSNKVRVCRYYVVKQIDQPYTTAVKRIQVDNAPDGTYDYEETATY